MKYLVHDLSLMTGIKKATIRKWQERYKLLNPKKELNGYYSYNFEDYLLLKNISHILKEDYSIAEIIDKGKNWILEFNHSSINTFSKNQKFILNCILSNQYIKLENYLNKIRKNHNFIEFIETIISPLVKFTGNCWENKFLTIADENCFSKWILAYLYNISKEFDKNTNQPINLITPFPGDLHEIGAFLFYLKKLSLNEPSRFIGSIPFNSLITEINNKNYENLFLSLTLVVSNKRIKSILNEINSKTKIKKITLGGIGYHSSKEKIS